MKDDRLYLMHILECIERIQRYTAEGKDFFFVDTKTQDAVNRIWPSPRRGFPVLYGRAIQRLNGAVSLPFATWLFTTIWAST